MLDYCNERNGEILQKYKCPKTKLTFGYRTCEYKNQFNEKQFVNGCSGPSGGHTELFFNACIKHDLCYHHEPSTNGYKRKHCDQLFLTIATNACDAAADLDKCRNWAKIMYRSLRVVGALAFNSSDEPATY